MKTAQNEATPGDLAALLANARQFCMWETVTVTLADSTVITWTIGDVAGVAGASSVGAEPTANLVG